MGRKKIKGGSGGYGTSDNYSDNYSDSDSDEENVQPLVFQAPMPAPPATTLSPSTMAACQLTRLGF
jgi:hypothetical protein